MANDPTVYLFCSLRTNTFHVCFMCMRMRSPPMSSAQPSPIPCAAMNTDHGVVPIRWGAHRTRTATATLGAKVGAAVASASFAAATTSDTVIANIVPGNKPALDTICNTSLIFCQLNVCIQLGSLGLCTHQAE
jgi:hypothetical protein